MPISKLSQSNMSFAFTDQASQSEFRKKSTSSQTRTVSLEAFTQTNVNARRAVVQTFKEDYFDAFTQTNVNECRAVVQTSHAVGHAAMEIHDKPCKLLMTTYRSFLLTSKSTIVLIIVCDRIHIDTETIKS